MSLSAFQRAAVLALTAFIFGSAGCARPASAGDDRAKSVAELRAELDAVDARITQAIGDPLASRPEQCKVIGLGDRPCGGPSRYVAYSTQQTGPAHLNQLAERGRALERALNQRQNRVSTCMALREPLPVLKDGRCTTGYPARDPRTD